MCNYEGDDALTFCFIDFNPLPPPINEDETETTARVTSEEHRLQPELNAVYPSDMPMMSTDEDFMRMFRSYQAGGDIRTVSFRRETR